MKNLINRELFSSTFPEDGLEFCINQIEGSIVEAKVRLLELEPDFKAAEEMYLKAKREFDAANDDVKRKTMWLANLVANRGNNKGKADIRIMRTTSHNDAKGKNEDGKRESWLIPAIEILQRENSFLTLEQIFEFIIKEYPHLRKKYSDGYSAGIKVRVMANLIRAANGERRRGPSPVVIYKEKIGLSGWVVNGQPLPIYLKAFMFNGEKAAS